MSLSPAERAVLQAAVARGYLTQAQVDALLADPSLPGGALAKLGQRLSHAQIAELRHVYDEVVAGGTLAPSRPMPEGTLPPTREPLPAAPAAGPAGNLQREQATVGPAPAPDPRFALPQAPAVLQPGELLGGCRIVRELARGGMGVVYVAEQEALGRRVAVKLLLGGPYLDPAQVERFRLEAEATAKLSHPHIVPVHAVGSHGPHHFMVMDLIEGEGLDARLEREGPLDPLVAARITRDLASALQHAHEAGVLHRDLKPSNVLLSASGVPRLTDFGLARLTEARRESLTKTGEILGTPAYMPPEQATGEGKRADARADVYSLGATLYALLTGEAPFRSTSMIQLLAQIAGVAPEPPSSARPEVPAALDAIVLKCLEKAPGDRYASAAELFADLEAFLEGGRVRARRGRRGLGRVLLGLGALGALGGVAVWASRPPQVAPTVARAPATRLAPAPTPSGELPAPSPDERPTPASPTPAPTSTAQEFFTKQGYWSATKQPWVSVTASGPPARTMIQDAMTYDPDRQVVWLFGGYGGPKAEVLDDLWSWNGRRWSRAARSDPWPPGRNRHSLVYDEERKRLVLYGGELEGRAVARTVWEFDGRGWSRPPVRSATRPGPRYGATTAFDPRRRRVVLFAGGSIASGRKIFNDVWEWDGARWSQRVFAGAGPTPDPRVYAGGDYDREREAFLVFGGIGAKRRIPGRHLELPSSGDAWRQMAARAVPLRREGHVLVTARSSTLVFGGKQSSSVQDSWLFQGGAWRLLVPKVVPRARAYAGAAYDRARRRVVLFGGAAHDQRVPLARTRLFADTWEYELD